jgi:methylenetetrahydrofolate dehydrogenase (NADP+)/methenyltetrahydrofolate cyclohydrolase
VATASGELILGPVTATLMDGKALAERIRAEVAREVAAFQRPLGLATVLVGDDPASDVYIRMKHKATVEVGIGARDLRLPATTTEEELLALVAELNADDEIDGILVQLPLPGQIDEGRVIRAVDPVKDVDGFHPVSAGHLLQGEPTFVAATPAGIMEILRAYEIPLLGARAVVVGRSNIVGKPMAQLLLQNDCTVTIAHSRSRDLPGLCAEAEILVAAIGRPKAVAGEWIRPGAVVIDVGINRVDDGSGKTRLVGDVDYAGALTRAGAITPVPGGVGPMTIACLLLNTLNAAIRAHLGAGGGLLSPF